MPAVIHRVSWAIAELEGCMTSDTTVCMPSLKNRAATANKMQVSSNILAVVIIFCLLNILSSPCSGLRRLKSGMSGLRLCTQPPDATAARMAADMTMAANAALPVTPTVTASLKRVNMVPVPLTVAESNESCLAMSTSSWSNSVGANASNATDPTPSTARCERSWERLTWPSSRAFLSLRSEAGKLRSWLPESMVRNS